MKGVLNLVSEETFAEKMDVQNRFLAGILTSLGGDLKPTGWAEVQALVRAGLASKVFAIGDQLICQKNGSPIVWDIIGIDHDTPADKQFAHSMTLQVHNCLPSTMQHANREALYYAETELSAGTYCFTIPNYDAAYGGNKTYHFTLTKPVPAGGHIVFNWNYQAQAANSQIYTYESQTSTTSIEKVDVAEGSSGTSLGTADGNSPNVNHIHRAKYGSNNYANGALRQFLNSNQAAGGVWTPQSKFDRAPSWAANTAGFMNGMDEDFLAVIGATEKVTCLNAVTDGGSSVITKDKFFLLSRREVFAGDEVKSVIEGEPYPYYSEYSDHVSANNGADSNRSKYRSGNAQTWWLRTPYISNGNYMRTVHATGVLSDNLANNPSGVAPACNII